MDVTISKSTARGEHMAPPSKSMAHRYLICAALAKDGGTIEGLEYSQDVLATLDCLKSMGGASIPGDKEDCVHIEGVKDIKNMPSTTFECRESGSTLRFFIPIAMLSDSEKVFHGSKTLLSRPLSVYEDICSKQGIDFYKDDEKVVIKGSLKPDEFNIPGNISSQFISGLLFVLPMLNGDSVIKLIPPVDSRSYIDLTISALSKFGVTVSWSDDTTLFVKGNQEYKKTNIVVEGDYSNAAFLDAFNYIGGSVKVTGLDDKSLQGDRVYKEHFEALRNGNATIDISDCPDLGPVLFTVAAVHNGGVFTGTRRLKIKESDRGTVMCEELSKFGIKTVQEEDTITVYSSPLKTPAETVSGHNDHRIVMSMTLLLSLTGGSVDDAEAVRKSYPSFFDVISELGIEVKADGMDK